MPTAVTTLLARLRAGDRSAQEELIPLVYEQLHRIAQSCMRGERGGHTLQPTSLVNEAWLKLSQNQKTEFNDRAHFFGIAARLMRQILVDHARATLAAKRGSGKKVPLPEHLEVSVQPDANPTILAIHEALDRLAIENESRARLIEMRYFAGMNLDEIAAANEISVSTVHRELRVAQAWLRREANPEAPAPSD